MAAMAFHLVVIVLWSPTGLIPQILGPSNAHDILTRNWYQKTGTSFWYVCHAIWYQFLSGTRFWYQIEHVIFSARNW